MSVSFHHDPERKKQTPLSTGASCSTHIQGSPARSRQGAWGDPLSTMRKGRGVQVVRVCTSHRISGFPPGNSRVSVQGSPEPCSSCAPCIRLPCCDTANGARMHLYRLPGTVSNCSVANGSSRTGATAFNDNAGGLARMTLPGHSVGLASAPRFCVLPVYVQLTSSCVQRLLPLHSSLSLALATATD